MENVPGLLSHDGGRTLDTILSLLVEMGYYLEWCVLDSKHFGVPQQRHRLYIVGYLGAECAGQIFSLESRGTELATTRGGKTGLYFIDTNPDPKITDVARCLTASQNSGIGNRKGEHSAVLIEEAPEAVIHEPVFTIIAKDRHGIVHRRRIRKLTPREYWRLQGYADEQFDKASALGLADGQLYKMAGNSVTVPVISAIGQIIKTINEKYEIVKE